MNLLFLIIASFLIGSIPTGYLLTRLVRGVDIRKFGSGNVGATNVFRVLGRPGGGTVLLFDIFKGFFCVVFLPRFLKQDLLAPEILDLILGLVVISGHNWSIFLKFKGGKGMATSLGVIIGLAVSIAQLQPVLALSIIIWLIVFLVSGFVSLASIICLIFFPALVFFLVKSKSLLIFSLFAVTFGVFRHKSNIYRLLEKKENRVKFPWLAR